MTPADLERLVDRALRRLPDPPAPATLLPRVMAAVRLARPRPWYERAWLNWPLGWQLVSGAIFVALAAGIVVAVPSLKAVLSLLASPVSGAAASRAADVGREAGPLLVLARVLWTSLVQPALFYLLALVTVMGVACATGAAALRRVALGGATHP